MFRRHRFTPPIFRTRWPVHESHRKSYRGGPPISAKSRALFGALTAKNGPSGQFQDRSANHWPERLTSGRLRLSSSVCAEWLEAWMYRSERRAVDSVFSVSRWESGPRSLRARSAGRAGPSCA